jgi:hypothetical protein
MKKAFALALGLGLLAPALAFGQTSGSTGAGGVNSVAQPNVITGINQPDLDLHRRLYRARACSLGHRYCLHRRVRDQDHRSHADSAFGHGRNVGHSSCHACSSSNCRYGGTAASTTANPANTIAKHDTLQRHGHGSSNLLHRRPDHH